ncbi:MAG TPA: SMP-30/gluconolactonase/LRE family protein [Thermoanaerobaculia bacterium]|jgi:gluconolactonase
MHTGPSTPLLLLLLLLGASAPARTDAGSPAAGSPAAGSPAAVPPRTLGRVERLDAALDRLVPADAAIEVIAEGFDWPEGPVWIPDGGYLLFSDVPRDTIYRWQADDGLSAWLKPSGYTGAVERGGEMGSNGLLLDAAGRLVLCQHGDRRMARLDAPLTAPSPRFVTLAAAYDGKRFNSPNDAVFAAAGDLYFTDPPYGLAGGPDDPARELDFHGVYRVTPAGDVTLLTADLTRPNGIALSPDERTLYVANSDPERAVWMAYELAAGVLGPGRVFFDATDRVGKRPGLPDGLAVDRDGNLFATGPGGVLVLSPAGVHLGTLDTTRHAANCTFGGDGSTLYVTADDYLLRVRLTTKGQGYGD